MTKPVAPKLLAFHKAASMFPLMKGAEFDALVDDIKQHGLQNPITVIRPGGSIPVNEETIIDGRNRYRATLQAKVTPRFVPFEGKADDVVPFIISANIRRRHLKTAEKRKLIADLIKMMPEKSDRQIAATLDASPTTVGTVRAEMEETGDVSKLDTRTDSKGRKQPAVKKARAKAKAKAKAKTNGAASTTETPAPAAEVDAATLAKREELGRKIRAGLGTQQEEAATVTADDDDAAFRKAVDDYKRDPSQLARDLAELTDAERQALRLHCDESIDVYNFFVNVRSLLGATDTDAPAASIEAPAPADDGIPASLRREQPANPAPSAREQQARSGGSYPATALVSAEKVQPIPPELLTAAAQRIVQAQTDPDATTAPSAPQEIICPDCAGTGECVCIRCVGTGEEPHDSISESGLLTDACGALLICFERLRAPEGEIKASLSPALYSELRRQFPLTASKKKSAAKFKKVG